MKPRNYVTIVMLLMSFSISANSQTNYVSLWEKYFCNAVAVQGDYAYVTTDDKLYVVDISNVNQPNQIGDIEVEADYLAVSNNFLVTAKGSNYTIFNISTPMAIKELSSHTFSFMNIQGVKIVNQYMYFIGTKYFFESTKTYFCILDMNQPDQLLTQKWISGGSCCNNLVDLEIVGNRAYLIDTYDIGNLIYDITDKQNVILLGPENVEWGSNDRIDVLGQKMTQISSSGLTLFDVNDPQYLNNMGSFTFDSDKFRDVILTEDYIFTLALTDNVMDGEPIRVFDPALSGDIWEVGDYLKVDDIFSAFTDNQTHLFLTGRMGLYIFPKKAKTAGQLNPAFATVPRSGELPHSVSFINRSTGPITGYSWDFGDGTTSQQQNPSHTYDTVGTFDVKLTVSGTSGSASTLKQEEVTVVLPPAPVARFRVNRSIYHRDAVLDIRESSTGQINSWFWDLGDGTTSTHRDPTHSYSENGFYTIKLIVTGYGGSDTLVIEDAVEIIDPLIADFEAEPRTGQIPLEVQFNNLSSGNIHSYEWDFGDGHTSTEENPTHTYTEVGIYNVELKIKDQRLHEIGWNSTDLKQRYDYIKTFEDFLWSIEKPWTEEDLTDICFVNSDTGFIVGTNGLFAKSTDGGRNWENQQLINFAIFACDFINSQTGFLVHANYNGQNQNQTKNNLLITHDGGVTWEDIHVSEHNLKSVDFISQTTGWVAGYRFLLKTEDGGRTWEDYTDKISNGYPNITKIQCITEDSIFAVYEYGVMYSFDGGENWEEVESGDDFHFINPRMGWIIDRDEIYKVKYRGGNGDKWRRWTQSAELPYNDCFIDMFNDQIGCCIGPDGFMQLTRKGGEPWEPQTNGTPWDFNDVEIISPDNIIAIGDNGTLVVFPYPKQTETVVLDFSVNISPGYDISDAVFPQPNLGWAPSRVAVMDRSYGPIQSKIRNWRFESTDTVITSLNNPAYNSWYDDWESGNYNVTLYVGETGDTSLTSENHIRLGEPKLAKFSQDVTKGSLPLTVQFTDSSTGEPSFYHWDFGDGETSAEINPVHTYTRDGMYNVSLTVGDDYGEHALMKEDLISIAGSWAELIGIPWNDFGLSNVNGLRINIDFIDENHGWITRAPSSNEDGIILKTTDGGTQWTAAKKHNEIITDIVFIDNKKGWICDLTGTIKNSVDGGDSWAIQFNDTSALFNDAFFLNENKGWCIGDRIMATSDGGTTWEPQMDGFKGLLTGVHFIESGHGWACGDNGLIFKTKDWGETWLNSSAPYNLDLTSVFFIDSLHGWIGTKYDYNKKREANLLITEDGGINWDIVWVDHNYDNVIKIHFFDDSFGYCMTDRLMDNLMKTYDGGQTWANEVLPSSYLMMHATDFAFIDNRTGWMINYRYIYSNTGAVSVIDQDQNKAINTDHFYLLQNHPNPFNPVTRIQYTLPTASHVKIMIYDITGRMVEKLRDQVMNAGNHTLNWDASELPSGVYFYRLESDLFTDVKKCLLIK